MTQLNFWLSDPRDHIPAWLQRWVIEDRGIDGSMVISERCGGRTVNHRMLPGDGVVEGPFDTPPSIVRAQQFKAESTGDDFSDAFVPLPGWPDMRPMATARRNGTRIMVAFRSQRPGFAPFHSITWWCTPAEDGAPLGREKRTAIEKWGGYWTAGKGNRVIKNTPLGWWPLPPIDAE